MSSLILKITLLFLVISTTYFSASVASENLQPITLKTQNNAEVTLIFNTIFTALLKRLPGSSDKSQGQLLADSDFAQGHFKAQFNYVESSENAATIDGTLSMAFLSSPDKKVVIATDTQLQLSKDAFLNKLTQTLSLIRKTEATPVSDLADFKNQLITAIDSLAAPAQKKRQTFGFKSAAIESPSTTLSPELVEEMKKSLNEGLQISQEGNAQVLNFDMQILKTDKFDLSKVSPALSLLSSLESLKITLSDTTALISISSQSSIPQQTLDVYDMYLSQQQAQENGLKSIAELIRKLGPWAVGRCAQSKYQAICIDKLIVGCAKDVDRVAGCVANAESVQKAREQRADGNTLGALKSGADVLLNTTTQSVEDGIDSALQWIKGEDSTTEKPEAQ